MKTLQQVEPRAPISSAPFTISQPGSYYLTTNLTVSSGSAIIIATNGVTLDLNGYTIRSTANPANAAAIWIENGLRNLAILNGNIEGGVTNNAGTYSGPGFGYGVIYPQVAPRNVRVSGLNVSGCSQDGINVGNGDSTVVESSSVRTVGRYGIVATVVKNCTALECADTAIAGTTVSDCRGESTGSGHGVFAATTAQNCSGNSASGHGVYSGSTAQNCYGFSNSGRGVYAYTALNCYGNSTGNNGVDAMIAQNCYGISSTGDGVYAYHTAQNCYGYSNTSRGVTAGDIAIGCFGKCGQFGTGVSTVIAAFCSGWNTSGGTAINAAVANSCYVILPAYGTITADHKYNMP
ncbi:hypothetical protein G4L39_00340 [Limisphaera ngatamarikiensis]|uniref:Right-handed parallel beta-helix repeat-containing protein n=1 Tax=Limisphaera ngatamarikiensis TaxID=1324935 RepID=A0A6M1RQZ1_9BACT|nr:hypothetical protein [Limisphaera ngatamarikiensis]NGO37854.1 hypothetical protein [Limisphaera ngatamarikiensis]